MEKEREIPRVRDLERVLLYEGETNERWVWRINGTKILHHPHEPAQQYRDGDWFWFWMNKRHRLDGPAVYMKGIHEYFIHGKYLSKEEWERHPLRLEWLRERALGI